MSTAHVDITYDLIDGIFDILDGNVTYNAVTYPVYKSVPKIPAATYVWIGDIIQAEDGTKDYFIYTGTVQIHVVDESKQRGDTKLASGILSVVRGLLKPARSTTFTCGSRTLVAFTPESLNTLIMPGEAGLTKIRMIDMYNFIIE